MVVWCAIPSGLHAFRTFLCEIEETALVRDDATGLNKNIPDYMMPVIRCRGDLRHHNIIHELVSLQSGGTIHQVAGDEHESLATQRALADDLVRIKMSVVKFVMGQHDFKRAVAAVRVDVEEFLEDYVTATCASLLNDGAVAARRLRADPLAKQQETMAMTLTQISNEIDSSVAFTSDRDPRRCLARLFCRSITKRSSTIAKPMLSGDEYRIERLEPKIAECQRRAAFFTNTELALKVFMHLFGAFGTLLVVYDMNLWVPFTAACVTALSEISHKLELAETASRNRLVARQLIDYHTKWLTLPTERRRQHSETERFVLTCEAAIASLLPQDREAPNPGLHQTPSVPPSLQGLAST